MPGPRREERVLDEVSGGVRGGQRDGDDEAGGGETQQTEDERLATPAREELLENRDAALAVRAQLRHPAIHRQGAEQGEQHENDGGDRRQEAGGEEGNAWLVAEGREVVHPGEAHDLPPRSGVVLRRVRGSGLAQPFEEPTPKSALLMSSRVVDHRWFRSRRGPRRQRAPGRSPRRTLPPTWRRRPSPGSCRSR